MNEHQRAYAYRILLALGTLAGVYGLATQEEIAAWVAVGSAIIGNGLATRHTSL